MGKEFNITSASGFVALLDESALSLKVYALQKLNELVSEFWAEIADSVSKIEELSQNNEIPQETRNLASLVASKVFFHLGETKLSLTYALSAGSLFDVNQKDDYSLTIVANCVSEYINQRIKSVEASKTGETVNVDSRLEEIVNSMWNNCFEIGEYQLALGIALDSRRIDKVEESITKSPEKTSILKYCFERCTATNSNRDFKQKTLRLLVSLYEKLSPPDYLSISQCLIYLQDHQGIAQVLNRLVEGDDDQELLAYQIAFDLYDNSTQKFLSTVRNELKGPEDTKTDGSAMEVEKPKSERKTKLMNILSGEVSVALYLDFLSRNNHGDLLLLKNIKGAVDQRNTVYHSAIIFANALMHAGTTRDAFLRENLEWLSRATNWAKFSATAGLGVLHKGHIKEGLSLLAPYLPQPGVTGSPYSEGGALYALGIIHANHGEEISKYLSTQLRAAQDNQIIQHGACLGVGVAAMATANEEIYEDLKNILYTDSAVAGEAAGLALGLVMLGTASSKAVSEMLSYAHETQHEKIIRGLAMGIALTMYGKEEEADTLIEQLIQDKDPILRYGGMYTIGLAYAGTANNQSIKKLLHVAVSDVSDDVRRAAVIALGFLLFTIPKQCPKLVGLLAESYNPHVRYGATLAVGISCASTGMKEAIDLLEPMTKDPVDFVRQGAAISLALVLCQVTKAQEPKVDSVRKFFEERIAEKHEEVLARMGSIVATGILDAGGRNVTISLSTPTGHKNMVAIVGLAVFTQFWYWFPLIHFISLSMTPTAVIGLNKDLKMPVMKFKSNAPPSIFAYPPETKPPTTAAPTKAPAAVLSITNKRSRARDKDSLSKSSALGESMSMDTSTSLDASASLKKEDNKETPEAEKKEDEKKEKEKEPLFEVLNNPARVTPHQIKYISFDADARYSPIKSEKAYGIVLLRDKQKGEPEVLVPSATAPPAASTSTTTPTTASTSTPTPSTASKQEEAEAPLPEPFHYPQ